MIPISINFTENFKMKQCFLLFLSLLFITSCDDGDIIVTNFDFDETNLSLCGDGDTKVLYKVSNQDIFEAISFSFNDGDFNGLTEGTEVISLNTTNQVIYRTFDDAITGTSYFCTEIPPSSPNVEQEFISTTGGEATFTTTIEPDSNDEDGDGLTNTEEGISTLLDTDEDGIPNYQDIDDDGDNVPTSSELGSLAPTTFLDTDEDETPNYLDNDDDGDGILTRNEDEDMNVDPRNDIGVNAIALYLDAESSQEFIVTESIANSYNVLFRTRVIITNLTFDGGDIQAIEGTYDLGLYEVDDVEITIEGN